MAQKLLDGVIEDGVFRDHQLILHQDNYFQRDPSSPPNVHGGVVRGKIGQDRTRQNLTDAFLGSSIP